MLASTMNYVFYSLSLLESTIFRLGSLVALIKSLPGDNNVVTGVAIFFWMAITMVALEYSKLSFFNSLSKTHD